MNDGNARQQIVESIKGNSNILVTVSTSPSVDELSAALGLTILLNNLGKRATAVVSGKIPPAITFLDPEKTFEDSANSLRDFIIALDKEKADHLRYKVDGDVVKIFITPYRTVLSDKDLEFSQGDYNVELIIALGVKDQDHLDKALDAHGRILHDATVATICAGTDTSTLGSISWQDEASSSLCEMLVGLSEALKDDKPLLDEQISTAFLTGIVSATDRFSNKLTSSRVMTMAAQLMAAGANQQLIAAKLEEAHDIGPKAGTPVNDDGTTHLAEGESTKLDRDGKKSKKAKDPEAGLAIAHAEPDEKPVEEPKEEVVAAEEAVAEAEAKPEAASEAELSRELEAIVPATETAVPAAELGQQLEQALNDEPVATADATPEVTEAPAEAPAFDFESLLPPPIPPAEPEQNQAIPPPPPAFEPTTAPTADIASLHPTNNYINTAQQSSGVNSDGELGSVDPFATPLLSPHLPALQPDPLFDSRPNANEPVVAATLTPPDMSEMPDYEAAPIPNTLEEIASVPDFAETNPTGLAANPVSDAAPSLDSLPPLPPLPDFSTLPPAVPPSFSVPPAAEEVNPLEAVAPALPPMPVEPPIAPGLVTEAPAAPAPGQFKIPGQ